MAPSPRRLLSSLLPLPDELPVHHREQAPLPFAELRVGLDRLESTDLRPVLDTRGDVAEQAGQGAFLELEDPLESGHRLRLRRGAPQDPLGDGVRGHAECPGEGALRHAALLEGPSQRLAEHLPLELRGHPPAFPWIRCHSSWSMPHLCAGSPYSVDGRPPMIDELSIRYGQWPHAPGEGACA